MILRAYIVVLYGHDSYNNVILEWTARLDTRCHTSSRTLFVREGGCQSGCPRHVERRVT